MESLVYNIYVLPLSLSKTPQKGEGEVKMSDNILPAIIAGIFALIGSFFGSKLNRKSQHEKIILENRIPIFKNFLQAIAFCENEKSKDTNIPYYQICKEVESLVSITSFYLNPNDHDKFYKLSREYIHNFETFINYSRNPHDRFNLSLLGEKASHAKTEIETLLNSYL